VARKIIREHERGSITMMMRKDSGRQMLCIVHSTLTIKQNLHRKEDLT